jgi:transcriptional regulator with XRE-family HTH domain
VSPRKSPQRPHAAAIAASDGQPVDGPANVDGLTLGARLRVARQRKHLTMRTVAERSGLSRGFINQVELGQVSPSFASLSKIADSLGESLVELFQPPTRRREGLVRAGERVRMTLPEGGYLDEILTPSLEGKLLVLRSTILPGAESGPAYHHDADEECVILLDGRLQVTVEDQVYDLAPGDALTYRSLRPHAWRNSGDQVAVAIWVITPPKY